MGQKRVPLDESGPVAAACRSSSGPESGYEAVEVGTASARRALDQGQAIWKEDGDGRAGVGCVGTSG